MIYSNIHYKHFTLLLIAMLACFANYCAVSKKNVDRYNGCSNKCLCNVIVIAYLTHSDVCIPLRPGATFASPFRTCAVFHLIFSCLLYSNLVSGLSGHRSMHDYRHCVISNSNMNRFELKYQK